MEDLCAVKPRPKNIKDFFTSLYFWKPLLAIVIGGLAGFAIYYFVSCNTELCTFSESTYFTILTGSMFGLLLTNSPCLKCSVIKK